MSVAMGTGLHVEHSIESEALRRLGSDERLILNEKGHLVLDAPGWSDVEIIELTEEAGPDTIDLDLDDDCILCVQEVPAQPRLPKQAAAPPRPSRDEVEVVRGEPVARVSLRPNPQRAAIRAMAAGDFAQAQRALGHAPRRRVLTRARPPSTRDLP